jgi:class 3 adenylate cyclase
MNPAHRVLRDPERLAALASYKALDTPPEFEHDALTEIAADICGFPVALISLMDEHRQWFKSNYGLPAITECPPEISVCSTTICSNDMVYVPDLTKDARFKELPTVTGEPRIRAYCGMPLINPDGFALGTLCIIDFEPHPLSPSQRESVRRLARQAMSLLELRRQLLARDAMLARLEGAVQAAEESGKAADALLRSIFPASIAEELKATGRVKPRYYELATILFCDFKDFTLLTEGLEPARLIEQLNRNFASLDDIAAANRVVPVRTVGDGCLCVAGLPEKNSTHPLDGCLAALQLQRSVAESNRRREQLRLKPWLQRIGINTGPIVAGVVGSKRYTYDVWGSAVNAAARLEQACEPGRINVSSSTLHYVGGLFETEPRGSIEVKNLGAVEMHFLNRIRPEFSADAEGCFPNKAFWQRVGLSEPQAAPRAP